jgi:LEA14-like dessication related protein
MKPLLLATFALFFLLTGCFDYNDIVYHGVENVKLGKPSEGNTTLSFNINLDNPNIYNIKIKPSDLTIFMGDKELGEVHLKERLVIQKQTKKSYPVSVEAKLKDVAKSGLIGLIELVTKKKVTIRFKGYIKGSIYGLTQKQFIDQTKEIETAQFLRLIGL